MLLLCIDKFKPPVSLFNDPTHLASLECWKNIIVCSTLVNTYLSLDAPNDGNPERNRPSVTNLILPEDIGTSNCLSMKSLHLPSHDKNEGVTLSSDRAGIACAIRISTTICVALAKKDFIFPSKSRLNA